MGCIPLVGCTQDTAGDMQRAVSVTVHDNGSRFGYKTGCMLDTAGDMKRALSHVEDKARDTNRAFQAGTVRELRGFHSHKSCSRVCLSPIEVAASEPAALEGCTCLRGSTFLWREPHVPLSFDHLRFPRPYPWAGGLDARTRLRPLCAADGRLEGACTAAACRLQGLFDLWVHFGVRQLVLAGRMRERLAPVAGI